MAYFSQETLHDIQSQASIVDYIGQYVQLKKAGKDDYIGLCPFHNEKTPSFHVNEAKHVFHCFGCGKSGNIFQFAEYYDHLPFPEAVQQVASFARIPLAQASYQAQETTQSTERRLMLQLHQKAGEMYEHLLWNTDVGRQALDYLHRRGLSDEDIHEFNLGYAPDTSQVDVLVNVLGEESLSEEQYAQSGLFIMDRDGKPHDRFSNRVMFPLKDKEGRIIAFSGRLLTQQKDAEHPKYLNSPETMIFNKRQLLFNFDKAYREARRCGYFVLFEGYMDVIAAHRAGVKSGIASMGTSLTEEQIQRMKSICDKQVICYDGDNAGIEATARAIHLMNEQKVKEISVVSLPEGKDPDEYIQQYGTQAFAQQIEEGQLTTIQFMMMYLRRHKNMGNERERIRYIEQVLREIAPLSSVVERDVYLRQLSDEMQVPIDSLQQQLLVIKSAEKTQRYHQQEEVTPVSIDRDSYSPQEHIELRLLFRAMNEKAVRDDLKGRDFVFPDQDFESLYLLMISYIQIYGQIEAADFFNELKTEQHRQIFGDLLRLNMSEVSTEREISDYLCRLKELILRDQMEQLQQEMREANRTGNRVLECELSRKLMQVLKDIKQLK